MPLANLENRNKYALITGATSGIGYELAKLFAADSYNLILVARNKERLQEVTDQLKQSFSVEITPMQKDLFHPGAAVNVLVNDAGQGEWGRFIETALERDINIIQLNIISLLTLTKLYLKDMVLRDEGKILQLGSEAGAAPIPLLAVYSASKAFVLSFTTALFNELKDTNITITALLPGATDTGFFHKAGQEETVGYKEKELASPAEVAKDGYKALMNGESKIISGSRTKMHVFMNDLFGAKKSAANNRTLMEPANKENGRELPSYSESSKEREEINKETGRKDGDRIQKTSPSM